MKWIIESLVENSLGIGDIRTWTHAIMVHRSSTFFDRKVFFINSISIRFSVFLSRFHYHVWIHELKEIAMHCALILYNYLWWPNRVCFRFVFCFLFFVSQSILIKIIIGNWISFSLTVTCLSNTYTHAHIYRYRYRYRFRHVTHVHAHTLHVDHSVGLYSYTRR